MPRKPNLDRPVPLTLKLPETLRGRLDLWLFSPLEGRVRQGAYQEFFIQRLQEFFDWQRLDLSPFGFPPGYFVSGPKEIIRELELRLRKGAY
jgi:hypothetical protein